MEFFNRKEDVYDLELTSYGKYLLSMGKLNPCYYSFSDNDIVYDLNHSNISENLNDIHDRITLNPRIKAQVNYVNFESGSNIDKISTFEKEYSEGTLLGTSNYDDKIPSWDIKLSNCELSSSVQILTGTLGDIFIPQINLKDVYVTLKSSTLEDFNFEILENCQHGNLEICENDQDFEGFPDSTIFKVLNDGIILEISENNVSLDNENFEMELFEVSGNNLNILKSIKKFNNVNDGILEDVDSEETPEINKDFIEYYFDLKVDSEIDDNLRIGKVGNFEGLYDFNDENFEEC